MKRIAKWFAAWQERRALTKSHKDAMVGFEYALSVLRHETDPALHRQIEEQADSSPDSPFCLGMRIAIKGYSK